MSISGTIKPKGLTQAHLKRAGISPDYWEADFSNFGGPSKARDETKQYLQNLKEYKDRGYGILFAGKPGRGKTTLLALVLKYLARANWDVYMTSLSELVELIKRSWDEKHLVEDIDTLRHRQFLGIDDLGKEHAGPTGFSAVTFDNLLRYRMQHLLPTLFTTNLTRSEIENRYGESTLSLIEGKTKIISVQGQDYRQNVLKHEIQ